MWYCEISKEMSSLYFRLDVFCQSKAGVPEFDHCSVYSVHCTGGCVSNSGIWPLFSVQCTLYGVLRVKFWDSSPKQAENS
jgi:hypothetical protein